jgi:dipeptidyl-peptidase 4
MIALRTLLFCQLLIQSSVIPAQNQNLTIEDVVLKGKSTLAPEKLNQLAWIPNTSEYFFTGKENSEEILFTESPGKEKKKVISLSELNGKLKSLQDDKPLTRFPLIKWQSSSVFYFLKENRLYSYSRETSTLTGVLSADKDAENTDIEEHTLSIAFTIRNNLFIADRQRGMLRVTDERNPGIVCGQSVHRNEFGISKGTFWSPRGTMLAFYRMDETMVTDYPVLNLEKKPGQGENIKYPMAGMTSHQVTIGVFNTKTGAVTYLKTPGPDDHYLTNITWSPDESHIYVAELNRGQNHMKLNVYESSGGKFVKTLFEEKHEKYVEPEHGPVFLPGNPSQFLWFSEKDGFNHLYLYDSKTESLRQLTKGKWVVTDLLGFNERGNVFYFTSTKESPIERHVYSYDLGKNQITLLTKQPGVHTAQFNSQGNLFIDSFSSQSVPRIISVNDPKGTLKKTLLTASNPLKDFQMGEMKIFTLKAEDSTDLYCRLILPPGFNPDRKYPVFVYLYGGPHAQMVLNSWLGGADLWLHYMAQQGYVVFTLDNRGSANRGLAFEQAIFRKLGHPEVSDQLRGISYLKSQRYVDTNRMALHGWSYGGFMTTTIMTRYPGLFRAAVAGGPVIDWKYYEVMYTERYMDTPSENPEGYESANLLKSAANLKGRLMLIHGTSDDVVVWQHSLMFLKKCVDSGIPLDYFVYPGHKHNVTGPDRVHLLKKITEYFDMNVKNTSVALN